MLIAHFKGADKRFRDVIGLYVLDAESKTHLLVLDFDKEGWQKAISAMRKAAQARNIDAYVERSRSGNGGHVWFFFDKAIDAKLARDFGSALIAEAMALEQTINFDAFDRMLPAQTTIPEGGFGNLIAAPFQGWAQRQGNSVFVDENFVPYPDQWLFLSRAKKLDIEIVHRIADKSASGEHTATTELNRTTPWEQTVFKTLTTQDFPEHVTLIEADMLYISEQGLSANAVFSDQASCSLRQPRILQATSAPSLCLQNTSNYVLRRNTQ